MFPNFANLTWKIEIKRNDCQKLKMVPNFWLTFTLCFNLSGLYRYVRSFMCVESVYF